MRTIQNLVKEIKQYDSNSDITEWYVRSVVKGGEFKGFTKAGVKFLIDMDKFMEYLDNQQVKEEVIEIGKLRKIKA